MADNNNPIKYSDLVKPDDSITKLIAQLDQLSDAYMNTLNNIKSEAITVKTALAGVSGATESGRKSIQGATSDADKLAKAAREVRFAESENAKTLAQLNQARKEANELNKLIVRRNQSAEGSYNRLSAQYSINKIYLNNMTVEEREATKEGRQLVAETKSIYEEMKRLQEVTGKTSLNVGNYSDAAKGLTTQIENQTKELALLRLEGKQGTVEYQNLAKETAVLRDAVKDATKEITNMASDTSTLDSVLGLAAGASGGFAAYTGALELFGGESEAVEEAQKKGIKFGIWIEPEMVNPKSELYEKHKDWVIHLPNRDEYYFRNQMVLDLSNPKVQDHVFGVVDNLMTKYPGIAFFKWDCNSPITNIYSVYLKDKQSHLYVDYVRGLYKVLDRIKAKYPDLPMMLCAGGGGRSDYEALKYFTEFWPSDNTDPIERLFIQWGYSQIFPSKTLCAHVTTWNRGTSIKFRTDVAMMCKLGFDIKLEDMNQNEHLYCDQAVKNYNRLKPVILEGDLYRLVSPYGSNHTSSMFVGKDKKTAAVFAFDIHPRYADKTLPVRLQGLNADKKYRVKEINMMPGSGSSLKGNNQVFSGEYLMNVGLDLFTTQQLNSRLIEITEE